MWDVFLCNWYFYEWKYENILYSSEFIYEHILLYEIQSRPISSCGVVGADNWTDRVIFNS
jgi:hypothetical protein